MLNLSIKITAKVSKILLLLALLFISSIEYTASNKIKSDGAISRIEIQHQNEEKTEERIEKKITIIVGDEEQVGVVTPKNTIESASKSADIASRSNPTTSAQKNSTLLSDCHKKQDPIFKIDEATKLIYIDENNESGLLFGQIISNETLQNSSVEYAKQDDRYGSKSKILDRQAGRPTNFSVFLISRNKNHIAILLDIEEIDFEPIINCEYQELRFSIVGEISKQLLDRKNNSDSFVLSSPDLNGATIDSQPEGQDESEQSIGGTETPSPPLPVSEAMALLLNAPLNKTILDDSSEMNDFRIIDTTIDYLHEETCRELVNSNENNDKTNSEQDRPTNNKSRNSHHRGKKPRRRQRSRSKGRRKPNEHKCNQDSQQFKELMSNKLHDYLEWDDFKIVCGKTTQLVIPMRSMKLSVFSDEFAPNSKFTLRYRFISDPSKLPAHDNGKYFCRNRNVIDLSLKCDGFDDCGDASDESVKVCGHPSGRSNLNEPPLVQSSKRSSLNQKTTDSGSQRQYLMRNNHNHHLTTAHRRKLTYFNGDVLHCCQSNDWQSFVSQGQANQMINLQSLIGESMKLFSGPLFAPTKSSPSISERQQHKRVKRIVGGSEAHRGAWPGQVSLQYELLEPLCHFCAGTLIHPQYVLTAGHCITKDGLTRGIKVVLGAHDLRQLSGDHIQVRYVDDAQIYPGVDVKHLSFDWENDMNNDIALLRLNAPVLITAQVAPACLPPFDTPLAVNTTCRSIGWGQTHGSGSSNLLKHLSLKVVDSSICARELLDRDNDGKDSPPNKKKPTRSSRRKLVGDFETTNLDAYSNQTMICVNNDLGHGICQGDSGGPLYCDRITSSGDYCTEIYGVASFIIQYATVGAMCAVENLPGIFGEVSSKTEWISSTIKMFEQTYRLKYS